MSDCEIATREPRGSKDVRSPSRSGSEKRDRNKSTERRSRKRYSRSSSRSRSHSRRSHSRGSPERSPRGKDNASRVENPAPCKCLGVFGLSLYTKERDLKDMFKKCGSIDDCTIVYDRRTGRSRGFGFVRFKYQEDADEARELMNGREFDSRKIRVDYSVTQRPHSPTPGIYMGRLRDSGRSSRYDDSSRDRRRYSRSRSRSPRSRTRSRSRSYRRR